MDKFIINDRYGYYEASRKPSEEELENYYEEKYYQNEHAAYSKQYSTDELQYFKNKITQKAAVVESIGPRISKGNLLDIGCGEGFTMDYYHNLGWEVTGLDFSEFGLKENHPHLKGKLKQGNIFGEVENLVGQNEKYNLVWLDNVLEHVLEPLTLLTQCRQLMDDGGVLVIEVPNDYSRFQDALIRKGSVSKKYWEAYPDHLNYFSFQSLKNLLEGNGFATQKIIF